MRPRVFVSSTFYDLKYIRNDLYYFINEYGFEPVLFENNGITFKADERIDESCYREIGNCHIVILIIGGHYGSPASSEEGIYKELYNKYLSVTLKEYRTAIDNKIPIFAFVDRNVDVEYSIYKKNGFDKSTINFAFADDINVYNFIHEIYSSDMYIFKFENFQDIKLILKDQWAGLMYEYLLTLRKTSEVTDIRNEISNLHSITEKMNIAVAGLVDKIFEEDSKKRDEISSKQLSVEYEDIFSILSQLMYLTAGAMEYSNTEKRRVMSDIVNTIFASNYESFELEKLEKIEGVESIDDLHLLKKLFQKVINPLIDKDQLIEYLVINYYNLKFLPF